MEYGWKRIVLFLSQNSESGLGAEPTAQEEGDPGEKSRGREARFGLVSREQVLANWRRYLEKPDAARASRQGPGFSPFR
jgi:hypothetical protein